MKGKQKYSEKVYTIEKIEKFMVYVEGKDVPFKFYEVKKVPSVGTDPDKLQSKKPEQKVQHLPAT